MIKVYGSMQSEQAASFISRMDTHLAASIMIGLKIRKAADIMAQMPPDRASNFTANLQTLWREKLIDISKIDKLVKVFEQVPPERIPSNFNDFADEQRQKLEKSKEPLNKEHHMFKALGLMSHRDAATVLTAMPNGLLIRCLDIFSKQRYPKIMDSFGKEKLLSLIEEYQVGFQQKRVDQNSLKRLLDYFVGLKPEDAARIIDEMPMETAASMLSRLKERQAAAILERVNQQMAPALTKKVFTNFSR